MKHVFKLSLIFFMYSFNIFAQSNVPTLVPGVFQPLPYEPVWQIGINLGTNTIDGDIYSKHIFSSYTKATNTMHIALHANYSNFGKYGYASLGIIKGVASGRNWQLSNGFYGHKGNPYYDGYKDDNGNVITTGYNPALGQLSEYVMYSYKTNFTKLEINQHASTNRKKKFSAFVNIGVGILLYKSYNDAYGKDGMKYNFQAIVDSFNNYWNLAQPTSSYIARNQFQKFYTNTVDGIYESDAESNNPGGIARSIYINIGVGTQYRISKNYRLQLHYNHAMTRSDLLDSYQWKEANSLGVSGPFYISSLSDKFDRMNRYTLGVLYNWK